MELEASNTTTKLSTFESYISVSKVVGENEGTVIGSFVAHPNKKRNAITDSKLFTKTFLFIFFSF